MRSQTPIGRNLMEPPGPKAPSSQVPAMAWELLRHIVASLKWRQLMGLRCLPRVIQGLTGVSSGDWHTEKARAFSPPLLPPTPRYDISDSWQPCECFPVCTLPPFPTPRWALMQNAEWSCNNPFLQQPHLSAPRMMQLEMHAGIHPSSLAPPSSGNAHTFRRHRPRASL